MIHTHIIGSQSKYCCFRSLEMEGVIVDIHPESSMRALEKGEVKTRLKISIVMTLHLEGIHSVLGNANTVVSDDNFSRRTTKIPYIGFHRTTIFSRAQVPNQLVSLIVLSGDSLRRVNKAKISIHA